MIFTGPNVFRIDKSRNNFSVCNWLRDSCFLNQSTNFACNHFRRNGNQVPGAPDEFSHGLWHGLVDWHGHVHFSRKPLCTGREVLCALEGNDATVLSLSEERPGVNAITLWIHWRHGVVDFRAFLSPQPSHVSSTSCGTPPSRCASEDGLCSGDPRCAIRTRGSFSLFFGCTCLALCVTLLSLSLGECILNPRDECQPMKFHERSSSDLLQQSRIPPVLQEKKGMINTYRSLQVKSRTRGHIWRLNPPRDRTLHDEGHA